MKSLKGFLILLMLGLFLISCREKKQEQLEMQTYEDSIKQHHEDFQASKNAATNFITQGDTTP